MSLVELRIFVVLGLLTVGVVTVLGALAVSMLVATAVQGSLRVAAWLGGIRPGAESAGRGGAGDVAAPSGGGSLRLEPLADRSVVGQRASWAPRC
jgi:Na+/citrate or Na+/malate symporter